MGKYKGLDIYFLKTVKEHGMKDECLLWPYAKNKAGYGHLKVNGKDSHTHRLSLEVKLGRPIGEGLCALHSHTGNRNCYAMAHLREGTQQDNTADSIKDGTRFISKGELHGNHRLTEKQVLEIRELYKTGLYKQSNLAEQFGLNQPQISSIISRKRWKHI